MIKVHHPEIDQEELLKAAGRIVTLVENNSHIKEASSSCVTEDLLKNNMPDDDHFMVHLIAMGDGETYGQNRNGDYWPKEANSKYHDTFVKQGHFFREHNNRDPKQAIGIVKASAYNPDMGRIELVIHGDKKKAEEEYELAKEGKALSFSMSARVPHDICNVCGNKATKSANYCEHLKGRMNQYIPEFQKFAYAINDKPTFFDISRVANPADRIAHYLDYGFSDELQKAASEVPSLIFSDQLAEAEGVCIPNMFGFSNYRKQDILEKLAAVEEYVEHVFGNKDIARDEKYNFVKYASENIFDQEELTDEELSAIRSIEPGTLFRKLASANAVMPFKTFVSYVTGQPEREVEQSDMYKYACGCMGNMFRNMMGSSIPDDMSSMFDPSSRFLASSDLKCGDDIEKLMNKATQKFKQPNGNPGVSKIVKITVSAKPKAIMKMASEDNISPTEKLYAQSLVDSYGMYKISYIHHLCENAGNFNIDEKDKLIFTCHNRII
jgi:hypothetical protein